MKFNKIKIFEDILNNRAYNGICIRCGNSATHALIWCKLCGDKFFRPPNRCTLWELIKITDASMGTGGNYFKPDYVAAVHKRHIKPYYEKQFQLYIKMKLNNHIGN